MDEVQTLTFLVKTFLQRQQRMDGRQFLQGRKPIIGSSKASSTVHLGYTLVAAKVISNVTLPVPSIPTEGILRMNVKTQRDLHPQTIQKIQLSLEHCIRDSKAIDLKSLCILPGFRVWEIEVCIHIMAHDGNLVECASIAAISAMARLKLPQVTYEICDGEITIHPIHGVEPVALNFNFIPMCISLGLFGQNKYIIMDPNMVEANCCDSIYTIYTNANKEICNVEEDGFLLLEVNVRKSMVDLAIKRAQEITHEIRAVLDNGNNKDLDCLLSHLQNVTI